MLTMKYILLILLQQRIPEKKINETKNCIFVRLLYYYIPDVFRFYIHLSVLEHTHNMREANL